MGMRHLIPIASLALALSAVAGCGGGGGGTDPGSSRMGVYVTDGFDDTYGQVWVTLYRIEASSDGTNFTTIFDDTSGKTINVARLANSAEFLGAVSLPQTAYTKVRVTIGDHILLVPKAGGAGQSVPVDGIFPTANGKSVISFDVTNPGSHRDLVIDFDLAGFQLIAGKVRPHLKHGDDDRFHHAEKHAEIKGTVSNLSAGGFDLVRGAFVINVVTNADTTIFSEKTGGAVTLANGQRVEVKGSVDPDTRTVLATSIKVEDEDHGGGDGDHHHEGAQAEGNVTSIDAADKSFVLNLHEAEDFVPDNGTVIVKTSESTVIEKRHHAAAAFEDIKVGSGIEASGTYDETTNTLTARRVEIR